MATFIKGRGKTNAIVLLAAAAQLEMDKGVVKAVQGGYNVPDEVAARYEELIADLGDAQNVTKAEVDTAIAADVDPPVKPEPKKAPAKKTPAAKKTAAKKTTAAKTAQAKE